jgi:hypothetical protein
MPVVEHERYVEAARGQQGLPQRHGRAGEAARQHAVPDACPEALFGAVALAVELVRRVYGRRETSANRTYPSRPEITK